MMISYAQNFEDVMLERVFKDVDQGFYIDVGAWDPDSDSVTRHFYDRGWRGVNIEPNPAYLARLRAARKRDVNLGTAVGAAPGKVVLNIIHGTGMSTVYDEVASLHAGRNEPQERIEVDVRTLNSIAEEHGAPEIHFLKIDCEGAETDVVNAFDLRRFRPWIILVESTVPLSQEQTHEAWEPHILEADYSFVYFDGVNRFYVAAEHDALRAHFDTPPNIFDDFLVDRMMVATRYLDKVEREKKRGVGKWIRSIVSR
jgi:FkbM family methyltransferase